MNFVYIRTNQDVLRILMISLPTMTFVEDFFSIINTAYHHNECSLYLFTISAVHFNEDLLRRRH